MLCQFTKLNFPTFPHSLKKKQVERLEWRSTELTKKEAGQTDEIFLSPRNKSFQNSNSNRRTCFFFSLFLASPIWDLEKFPTFLYSLKKKQVKRTKFFCPRLEKHYFKCIFLIIRVNPRYGLGRRYLFIYLYLFWTSFRLTWNILVNFYGPGTGVWKDQRTKEAWRRRRI